MISDSLTFYHFLWINKSQCITKDSDQPSPRDRQLHSKDMYNKYVGFPTKNTPATSRPAASMEVLGDSAPTLTLVRRQSG